MDMDEDISLFFTDGHVASKNLVFIAAKLNVLSDEDFSRVECIQSTEWSYLDIQDSVHSVWFVQSERSVYWLGRNGLITILGEGKTRTETIPDSRKYGFLNRIREIGFDLYICGYGGQVYKRNNRGWNHMDFGILDNNPNVKSVDLQDIDGTSPDDIYSVGTGGTLFHYNGKRWNQLDSPTNLHLLRVRCISKDEVYICGSRGSFYCGNRNGWDELSDPEISDDFWGLEYFQGNVYLSHPNGLFIWDGKKLAPINLGVKKNISAHRLHTNDGVLWSFGIDDLFYNDGNKWHEVICPENGP